MAEADPTESESSIQSDDIPVEVLLGRRKLRPVSVFELSFAPYDPESAHRSFVYHPPLTEGLCQMFLVKKRGTVYQHINFASTRFNLAYELDGEGEVKKLVSARREDGDYMPKDEIAMQLFTIIQLDCRVAAERIRKLSPLVCDIVAKLEVIVDKFTTGKYRPLLKPSLMLGRTKTRKFRVLHIFASVMYQIGVDFHSITCKIREVLNKSLIVDRVLVLPEVAEMTKKCTFVPKKLLTRVEEFEQILGTEKVVVDYVKGYGEIAATLSMAKDYLAHISKGIKVDKEYRKEVEKLIEVIEQLDPDDAIKLDAVIASISSNAALLGNRRVYIPNVTMECRSTVLRDMGYVCHEADKLCEKSKGIPIMAFFIAHHTMGKLLGQLRAKRIKKQRIKTDKARKKFKKVGAKLPAWQEAILRAEPRLVDEENAFDVAKMRYEIDNAPKIEGPVGIGIEFRHEAAPSPSSFPLPPLKPRLSEYHSNRASRMQSHTDIFVSATDVNSQEERVHLPLLEVQPDHVPDPKTEPDDDLLPEPEDQQTNPDQHKDKPGHQPEPQAE